MKKYGKLIMAAVALVVLIGAAHILYANLTESYQPDSPLQYISQETRDGEMEEADLENENIEEAEAGSGEAESAAPENANRAPDFAMIDYEGQSKDLHGFFGRPIVLNFWASWCGPCKAEFPDFQKAYEKYGDTVEFLMVNMTDGMRETKEKASAFVQDGGYTFPVYFDALQSAAYTYSVYSLPTTYFINASGELVAGAEGMLDAESLERGISMILPNAEETKHLKAAGREKEMQE